MLENKVVGKYTPLIRAIVIMIVCTFIIQVSVNYLRENSILPNLYDVRLTSVVIFAFVLEGFRVCLGLVLFRWVDKRKWSEFGLKVSKKDIVITLSALVLMIMAYYLFIFITGKTKIAIWNFRYMEYIVPIYLIKAILVRGIFVGMGEEFLYRGYLFRTLDSYHKIIQYGINILVFVPIHFLGAKFSLMYLIDLITATFLLIYIYDITKSIWPGVIIHGAIDAFGTLFSWNLQGVSLVHLYWHGKYSIGNSFHLLYIISNVILIVFFWYFYGRQSKEDIAPMVGNGQ